MRADGSMTLSLNRGSDLFVDLVFRDDTGAPVDMTGHTIQIVEAEPWALANASVAWVAQAAGSARLRADWTPAAPAETWVRLQTTRTADGFDDAAPKLVVRWL